MRYRELIRRVLESIKEIDQRLEYNRRASTTENLCVRCKFVLTKGGARYSGDERYVPICWECSRHIRHVPEHEESS